MGNSDYSCFVPLLMRTLFCFVVPFRNALGGGVDPRGREGRGGRRAGRSSLASTPDSGTERAPKDRVQCESLVVFYCRVGYFSISHYVTLFANASEDVSA